MMARSYILTMTTHLYQMLVLQVVLMTYPIYALIKDSSNTVESAIFKDIGFPSGSSIFVAAKEE